MWGPTKMFKKIGSDVLTIFGYKQTNKQTEKQSILYKYFVVLIKCKLEIESVRARECYNGGV